MANLMQGKALRDLYIGKKVDRVAEALAGTGTPGDPFFDVHGLCLVTGLLGVCTVACGVANTISFEFNPDNAAGANSVLSLAIDLGTAMVAGDVCVLVGAPGTALLGGHVAVNVLGSTSGKGVVMNDGIIGLVATGATGTYRWILFYVPIDDGAYIDVV